MENQKCKCGWLRPTDILIQPHVMELETVGFRCPVCGEWTITSLIETSIVKGVPRAGN